MAAMVASGVRVLACAAFLGIAGCDGFVEHPPLVSAQTPPGTGLVNAASEPQPINSLPPGAEGQPQTPLAVQPNFLSFTFPTGI